MTKNKRKVLNYLKEATFSEKEFNIFLQEDYNAYDNFDLISNIVNIYTNGNIGYDYISKEFDSYGQLSYWSKTIFLIIILSVEEDFCSCLSLDSMFELLDLYQEDTCHIEDILKAGKEIVDGNR